MKIKGKFKKAVLTAIYMPEDLFNELTELAEINCISRNRMIVNMLKRTVDRMNISDQEVAEALEVFDGEER